MGSPSSAGFYESLALPDRFRSRSLACLSSLDLPRSFPGVCREATDRVRRICRPESWFKPRETAPANDREYLRPFLSIVAARSRKKGEGSKSPSPRPSLLYRLSLRQGERVSRCKSQPAKGDSARARCNLSPKPREAAGNLGAAISVPGSLCRFADLDSKTSTRSHKPPEVAEKEIERQEAEVASSVLPRGGITRYLASTLQHCTPRMYTGTLWRSLVSAST